MKIVVDAAERSVEVSVPRKIYSDDSVRIAAMVFSGRAEIYYDKTKTEHALTLVARRKDLDAAALERLGGDCLNELLNQEYRAQWARFHRKIADRVVAQVLLAARGGETPAPLPKDSPELEAETKRLMAAAADEIARTMPKRIPPQGAPMRPGPEGDAR